MIKNFYPIDKILLESQGELTLVVNQVKLTFFNFVYDVPHEVQWDNILSIPDPLTIGAMKAFALGMRSKWKDYADLYLIFQKHTLEQVIDKAESIFGTNEFNSKLFREQLAYHDDISYIEPIEYLEGHSVDQKQILQSLISISLT